MKSRLILIVGILLISFRVSSQHAETILSGTLIKGGPADDESFGPFDIGFNFTFYNNIYTQFHVSSNGLVMFGPGSTESEEVSIPDSNEPNNFIAALWDDLIISSSGKILYTTIGFAPNRRLIIQCTNMGFYPNPIFMGTYIVILNEASNTIQVQYRIVVDATSARAHGESATIGIENADGTAGKLYKYHDPLAISTGKAISFTPSGSDYTVNPDTTYDAVLLTTNLTLPEPGIPLLKSPPQDAVIGSEFTFEWAEADNAASYTLLISTFSDLGGAIPYPAGTNLSYKVTGLSVPATYYWGVFATNATGETWCEIKKFTTSSAPPLSPVPQTVWTEKDKDKTIKLNYTGGGTNSKIAKIFTLPSQGQLFQYNAGVMGSLISSGDLPATVTDAGMNVIYSATGNTGNGVGNFNFIIEEGSNISPPGTVTVNVSPPGIPSVLYVAKSTNSVEIQFDRPMADPSLKKDQFTVTANGTAATINTATLKTGDPYSIVLTLGATLTPPVLISYSPGDIVSASGGFLLPFADQPVTLTSQTIDFSQDLAKRFSDSPFTLIATSSGGLELTYSSSNQSVATIVGNIATFHSIGSSDITARQAGNATYAPAKYEKLLTVVDPDPVTKTLNLTSLLLQGLYDGGGKMRRAYNDLGPVFSDPLISDQITVELHNSSYSSVAYRSTNVNLSTSGTAIVSVPSTFSGSYYITIKHRNHIETTTAELVSFGGVTISYAFDLPSKIYGGNVIMMTLGGNYAIFGGDVNQNGLVESFDMTPIDNLSSTFGYGFAEDVNSDGLIDSRDMTIVDNNNSGFVSTILP